MEQSYAETSVKQKTTAKVAVLKGLLIFGVILLMGAGFLSRVALLAMLSVAALILLIWYWPRFKVEWEYVYCDGQLDFDMIQGGEKRKTVLRIELENAAVIAPMDSPKMDGYRHLQISGFSFSISSNRPGAIYVKAFISNFLLYVQWQEVVIIETVKVRLEKLILNDAIFLKLRFSVFFSLFG